MYQTAKKNPIHLVHKDGEIVHTFKSYESLVYHWREIKHLDIGIKHAIHYSNLEWHQEVRRLNRNNYFYRNKNSWHGVIWPKTYHEYILRDSYGDTYDPEKIKEEYREKHGRFRHRRWWWSNNRHPAYGRFRHIKTFQERKWAHAWDDEEFAPPPRAARQGHNLPDPWDDYWTHNEKCWKKQSKRRHQWKPKT